MTDFIGIVTVLFNSDDVLPEFFESLAKQKNVKYRLYVIDNSKTDSGSRLSQELAGKYKIDVQIIFNNANVGVAKGNNQGIELALRDGCTHILLSNNDIEFKSETLISEMISKMEEVNANALVPKIYYHSDAGRIWCAGGYINKLAVKSPHYGDGEIDVAQYDKSDFVEYAPTCFMLISKNIFEAVGVMDEKYFVYYDDTDFILRFNERKNKLYYWSGGEVWHKVSYSTGGSDGEFSLFYTFRNRIYFVRKNYQTFASILSIAYIFCSAAVKFTKYDDKKRKAIMNGLKAGFAIEI
jgi:GT2 family glycosyltransferase